MLRIGQPIICVNASGLEWLRPLAIILPVLHGKYTVRGFDDCGEGRIALFLEEIRNQKFDFNQIPDDDGYEPSFRMNRFRPVVSRQTDISIFRELLNPTPQQRRELIIHDLTPLEKVGADS